MAKELTRRDILKGAAATAVGIAAARVGAATPEVGPDNATVTKPERLRVGVIGCGGKGWSGMQAAAQYGDIVAICDTDAKERSKGMLEYPRAACFDDYREMLKALRGHLDAVVISTPDHHHAPATIITTPPPRSSPSRAGSTCTAKSRSRERSARRAVSRDSRARRKWRLKWAIRARPTRP